MMKAVELKNIDEDYRNHLQAFLNFAVRGEKKAGKKPKPIYPKFKKFYDYEKEIKKVMQPAEENDRLQKLGKLLSRKGDTDGKL